MRASTNGVSDRDSQGARAFDEQRALGDLEKLHREIQRARVQRERAQAEFDEFVRGFRAAEHAEDRAAPFHPEVGTRGDRALLPPEPVADSSIADPVPGTRRGPRRTLGASSLLIAAVVLVAATIAIVLALRASRTSPENASPAAPPETSASRPIPRPPGAAAPPARPSAASPAPAAAAGVNLELATRRAVWMRVTIDGRRAFEREVPPDRRIPLRAQRAIAIRAGDAGAVMVTIDGRDAGPLGRDGAIVTRVFNAHTDRPGAVVR